MCVTAKCSRLIPRQILQERQETQTHHLWVSELHSCLIIVNDPSLMHVFFCKILVSTRRDVDDDKYFFIQETQLSTCGRYTKTRRRHKLTLPRHLLVTSCCKPEDHASWRTLQVNVWNRSFHMSRIWRPIRCSDDVEQFLMRILRRVQRSFHVRSRLGTGGRYGRH